MSFRTRRWPTPEESVAATKLDAVGMIVLAIGVSVSGVMLGLLARVLAG